MIKSDLVERVMQATDLPKPKASEAVNALFEGMKAALLRGDRIELRGFGVFQVKDRKRGIHDHAHAWTAYGLVDGTEVARSSLAGKSIFDDSPPEEAVCVFRVP